MAKSPAVILFDSNGVPMAVEDGVAIPVGTQALLAAGTDGTDAHVILTDSAGSPIVVGAGTAGTSVGGVVSVQGVTGGTPVPVTGTVTAANASVSGNNAAAPASSTQVGGSDGTNLQAVRVFDADTGAGSQYLLGVGLRKAASGGSVEAGTATDPLRVDPTGTTTQPISAATLPLPTGAATEATLATRLADATFTARINTLGQKTSANSTPVVLASDQSAIPITDNAGSLTVDTTQLPGALVGGRLDTNTGAWLGSTAPTVGQKTMANSLPIVIASDQTALPINTVGTHANAWNAAVTGTNGNSTAIDCQYTPYLSVFGNSNGSTTISVQASQNNSNFYTVDSISIAAGGGDFGGNYLIGARYVRLQSSTSRTVTATIAGKD